MSIAITGASGKLGKLILKYLRQQATNEPIIACVRKPEGATDYEELGVEVRYCDYDVPGSLTPAFTGVDKLLLISGSDIDDIVRLCQHTQVVEAAKRAGVKHLSYTGFAFPGTVQVPPVPLHLATEQAIITSGIPYTFFRNALYADLTSQFGLDSAIRTGELTTFPGEWRFNTVTREDLAKAISSVLGSRPAPHHVNRIYELTAPRFWTFQNLAEALSEISGKNVVHREDPQIQSWIYGYLSKLNTTSTTEDLETLIGGPATSLKESILPLIEWKK
ncbi:NAD(P)H-binding protein [Paenibacillus sp. FSL R7-0216]|uniref:NmrA family NAD(P)-binding protein n=1 Tax=Paenibacillus sp. FSL R7-0216 TaxID=2921677 RepID=UPI0030DD94C0